MKQILNSTQSRKIAAETIKAIASIVKTTLGPGGNPIIIQRTGQNPDGTTQSPLITKDGVSVAEAITLKNHANNTIAQAILQVAQNTVKEAGDGTTTAIVLAEAIFNAGLKYIEQGTNGIELYEDLKKESNRILAYIDSISKKVELNDVFNVAKISANGDEEIANIVFEAVSSVGEDGHIALEEGYARDTVLNKIDGAVYKKGWRSFGAYGAHFVNNQAKNTCDLESPAILLYNGKIADIHELGEFIKKLMGADEKGQLSNIVPLLIVANDFSDEVMGFVAQNRVQGKIPIAAIKTPFDGSPNGRTQTLQDLGVLLGAEVGSRGVIEIAQMTEEHLGGADKVEVSSEETVFYNGYGESEDIINRVEDLRKQRDEALYDFDVENLRIRIGKLTGGIAVVRVGGSSELEMLEKKDRIEDALCAARVAISEGIIPGGGSVFYQVSKNLSDVPLASKILREALVAPIKQLIINTGKNPDVILSHLPANQGYNARSKEYCDLLEAGIIDPAKVVKSALENAISIAGLLLTTGGAIVLDQETSEGASNPLAKMFG